MYGPENTRKRRILNVGRGSATCEDKEGQPVLFLLTSDATSHEKAVSFFFLFFQVCSSSKFVSSLNTVFIAYIMWLAGTWAVRSEEAHV